MGSQMNIFNSEISLFTVALLIFGILGLIFGLSQNKQSVNKVSANNGSVAAGGDINAPIIITHTNQTLDSQKSSPLGWAIWNI